MNDDDECEIGSWSHYSYYAASKADYDKWATHSGKNGSIFEVVPMPTRK